MKSLWSLLAIAVLATATTGCVATRKFVRNTTNPINQHVGDLDKRTDENAKNIGALDDKTQRDISRVNEKAETADNHAGEAAKQANAALAKGTEAGEKAGAAQSAADGARTTAETSLAKNGELRTYVDNLDNFKVASSKVILFGFNKSALTDDAMKDLDDLAQSLSNATHFVIEVQGFTDTTGDKEYNYALSEKRANAVVRYMTEKHNIPVYRIHTVGLGKDMPATGGANKRETNKLSRRVEVKVYTPNEQPKTAEATTGGQAVTTQAEAK